MLKLLADTLVNTSPLNSGGAVDDSMNVLSWYVIVLSIVMGGIVFVLLLYGMFRFRRRSEDDDPEQWHGNTRLEIGWTLVPLAAFMSIFGLTAANIGFEANAPAATASSPVMHVTVIGQQFSFTYDYGVKDKRGRDVQQVTELIIPANTPVALDLVSSDPPCQIQPGASVDPTDAAASAYAAQLQHDISTHGLSYLPTAIANQGCGVNHSFYVPSLAGQMNLVPGQVNHMWLQARAGHYYGQCTELCGVGHASMLIEVCSLPASTFHTWFTDAQEARATTPQQCK